MPDEDIEEDLDLSIFDDEEEESPEEVEIQEEEQTEEVEEVLDETEEPPEPELVPNRPPEPEGSLTPLERILAKVTGDRVKEACNRVPELQKFRDTTLPEEVETAREIMDRYVERGIHVNQGQIDNDILHLAAILVRIAEPVGYAKALGKDGTDRRRVAAAGFYTELSTIKEREGLPISKEDISQAARHLSAPYMNEGTERSIASEILTNIWFGINSFIAGLRAVRQQTAAERFADRIVADEMPTPRQHQEPEPTEAVSPEEGAGISF